MISKRRRVNFKIFFIDRYRNCLVVKLDRSTMKVMVMRRDYVRGWPCTLTCMI